MSPKDPNDPWAVWAFMFRLGKRMVESWDKSVRDALDSATAPVQAKNEQAHPKEHFPWGYSYGAALMLIGAGLAYLGIPDDIRPLYILLWCAALLARLAGLAFEWARVHGKQTHISEPACIVLRRISAGLLVGAFVVSAYAIVITRTASPVTHHKAKIARKK